MKALLCDINVILDIFLTREPFYRASAKLFQFVEEGKIKGYLCALSFPIIDCLLSRELSRDESRRILEKLRIVFDVAKVDARNIDLALASNFKDFEDAVQYYSAMDCEVDCIISRNKKDFPEKGLPVFTPNEFMELQ